LVLPCSINPSLVKARDYTLTVSAGAGRLQIQRPLAYVSRSESHRGRIMLKALHIALAYLTVAGFVLRAFWALSGSPLRQQKWVRIAPHVVDTLLLVLGVALAIQLSISPIAGWLGAKLVGLLAYIGFGVLTMRATSRPLQALGLLGALMSVGYIFAVAFTRQVWPF
jgi:uncharacterized membrane protein SirB2